MKWQGTVEDLDDRIKELRRIAEGIQVKGVEIEAVQKNVKRILASIKMLELNISDIRNVL